MTITDKTVALWFATLTPTSDWLAVLSEADDGFLFEYRFRYYADNSDPWSDKDRKSWYAGTIKGLNRDDVLSKVRHVAALLTQVAAGELEEIVMHNRDVNAFVKQLSTKPWAHMKSEL